MLCDYQDVMKRIITGDETWIYAYDPDQSIEYRASQNRKNHVKAGQKSKSC